MNADVDKLKKELRAKILTARRESAPEALAVFSLSIQRRLLREDVWKNAQSVALYVATQNEVDTALLLEAAWQEGKAVYLPRVVKEEDGKMHFAPCAGLFELGRGAYGIQEPLPELCPACAFTLAGEGGEYPAGTTQSTNNIFAPPPDLFIVPGVAFDRKGNRLGFGGGYYDRFLSGQACRARSFFVALAYAFQIVGEVPVGEWDQPVQAVCTEKEYWLTRS